MNEVQVNKFETKVYNWKRLRINNIHSTVFCLSDILLFNMASDCNDVESPSSVVFEDSPYPLDSLVAIHERHHAVGKDEGVPIWITFVYCLLDMLYQLFAIVAAVNLRVNVLHPQNPH